MTNTTFEISSRVREHIEGMGYRIRSCTAWEFNSNTHKDFTIESSELTQVEDNQCQKMVNVDFVMDILKNEGHTIDGLNVTVQNNKLVLDFKLDLVHKEGDETPSSFFGSEKKRGDE